jgi:putative peptidoglycan lipid II flippase
VLLSRITMPYLLFVSLLALYSGVLNAFHKFAAAAAAPVILNIVFIATLAVMTFLGMGASARSGVFLAWSVTIGGVLQFLAVLIAARRIGMGPGLRLPRLTPGVKRLLALGVPGVISGGIVQINIVIGTLIASMQDQAVAWLYYADRLYQLPLGVVGIAIGVVLLPDISRLLRAGKDNEAHDSQNRSMEFALLLTLPASVALAVIPRPLIEVLFQRGHFSAHDSEMVALALRAFAFGLPAFVLSKVFQPGFFAREDTKTPMKFAWASMIANIAASLALFPFLGHVGIAIATSISGWLNALLLWGALRRRGHYALDKRAARSVPRMLVASLLMGAALLLARPLFEPWLASGQPFPVRAGALAALVTMGMATYFLAAALLGAFSLKAIRARLRKR